jgi:hypothetical protein
MKARKEAGVWKLKELGFDADFELSGKHLSEVGIGKGNFLNLSTGEIFGRGSGNRRIFFEQNDGRIFAVDLEIKNESESIIQGMGIGEVRDGNFEVINRCIDLTQE